VTRIVIAHRLSTVQHADRILVLVGGRLVQSGTFRELSAASGVFAEFAKRQLL
jgi:ABC-type multidrug transport system fused ATPase/permease subunit